MIREEIRLRGISNVNLTPPEQRLLLHEVLITEHRYSLLKGLCESKTKEEAMILLEKAVPCLLHLENRVSECIIRMLFLKALSYIEDDNHATMEYILSMECYLNETIFGEHEAPSGWKFPYESNKLGEVKFSNWRARRIIEEFDVLVDLSIPETESELRGQWKNCTEQYSEVIRLLRRKKKYRYSNRSISE
jgi:hypothetical protein